MTAQVFRQPDPEIEDAELVEPAVGQVLDSNLTLPLGGETPNVPATASSTALEPATLTGEYITREARLKILESLAESYRDDLIQARVNYGMALREYRDLCKSDGARFATFLEQHGLTRRAAYQHIQVAEYCVRFPQLIDRANADYSKMLVVFQELDEQEIERVANGASDVFGLDEMEHLTVRQLKAQLRAKNADIEKHLERRTKVLTQERDALVAERDRLAAIASDNLEGIRKTVAIVEGQMLEMTRSLTGLYKQLDALPLDEVQAPGAHLLLEQVNGVVGRLARASNELWVHWGERAYQDWGFEEVPVNPLEE